jgi:hypothetical protein
LLQKGWFTFRLFHAFGSLHLIMNSSLLQVSLRQKAVYIPAAASEGSLPGTPPTLPDATAESLAPRTTSTSKIFAEPR